MRSYHIMANILNAVVIVIFCFRSLLYLLRMLLRLALIIALTCFLLLLDWFFKLPSTYLHEKTWNTTEPLPLLPKPKSPMQIPTFCITGESCHEYPSVAALAYSKWAEENHSTHLVNTSACQILEADPFDPPILEFMTEGTIIKCPASAVIEDFQKRKLSLDPEFVKSWKGGGGPPFCCYRTIRRVQQDPNNFDLDADWTVELSKSCQEIPINPEEGVHLNSSYVKVECRSRTPQNQEPHLTLLSESFYRSRRLVEFHGVPFHPSVHSDVTAQKVAFWDKRKLSSRNGDKRKPPSVLVIGIDSTSRMHMIRNMPKTRELLLQNDFIELKGYNKVERNTFPNLITSFAGLDPYDYYDKLSMDDCPFIWKDFGRQANYITAYLEDSQGLSTFSTRDNFFVLPPADYFIRPLPLAAHQYYGWPDQTDNVPCIGGLSMTDFMAKYIKEFVTLMGKDYPYFLHSWFVSVGHADPNGLQTSDPTFYDLLNTALNKSIADPDNTLIIFMSDHGYNFEYISRTRQGFYESNLPTFFIRLPQSLKEQYPEWYENLRRNSHLLTSNYDLYATFRQILQKVVTSDLRLDLNYPPNVTNSRLSTNQNIIPKQRYSFFEFIPSKRTCTSASIPSEYCMCGVTISKKKVSNPHLAYQVGTLIIQRINSILDSMIKTGKCAKLKYSKHLSLDEVSHGVDYTDYLTSLEAKPSMAQFESRVRVFANNSIQLLEDAARINLYRGQNWCVTNRYLAPYCFCI